MFGVAAVLAGIVDAAIAAGANSTRCGAIVAAGVTSLPSQPIRTIEAIAASNLIVGVKTVTCNFEDDNLVSIKSGCVCMVNSNLVFLFSK